MKYDKLVEHFKRDPDAANTWLRESLGSGDLKPSDFDLGRLFEECYGWSEFQACRDKHQLASETMTRVTEAQGAVTSSHFANITGQIVYSTVLQSYQSEDFIFTKLIPETQTPFLDGEKIAGITSIGDEVMIRGETDPYTLAGVGENWIFTPSIKDRGMIVPVTWEAIFKDRTGKLLEEAGKVGQAMGWNKEKRAIDCVIDENTTAHRYNWRGTVIESYNNNTGAHTWDNLVTPNTLLDHTSVNAAELAFNDLVDPFTGLPIVIEAKHLITVKALELTVKRIINSTQILTHVGGYATTGNPPEFVQANPYLNKYMPVSSRLLASRLAEDDDWFLGDVTAYAKYMVAEKMRVVQAPPNNHDEFHRQIVVQHRINERGEFVVVEPRAIVKSVAT